MQQFVTIRRRALPTANASDHPGSSTLTVEINLWAPNDATPDDVSRVLTQALVDVAETFGDSYTKRAKGWVRS